MLSRHRADPHSTVFILKVLVQGFWLFLIDLMASNQLGENLKIRWVELCMWVITLTVLEGGSVPHALLALKLPTRCLPPNRHPCAEEHEHH